jgi:polyphosphate kinase 2 (PPK2 family)
MGFCSEEVHKRFLRACPSIEKYVVDPASSSSNSDLTKFAPEAKKTVLKSEQRIF